ncbi:MAG: hypothetical protein P4L39_02080 [Humidesulfovibrio sp.]|nr:hypothetical protein [Humidesulfovibrio sp.]
MSTQKATTTRSKISSGGKGARMEGLLARIESVRRAQRREGNFDCFGKAKDGCCDQGGCSYRSDCAQLSQLRF